MDHIIIAGFMGSGKGSVGRRVAEALSMTVYDTDKLVAQKMKMTSADVYAKFGDVYYRAEETFILSELLQKKERCVIVLGSGLPLLPFNAKVLKTLGRVYWLKVSKKKVIERIEKSKKYEWLKKEDKEDGITSMLKERNEAYKRIADETIDADDLSSKELADMIVAMATGQKVENSQGKTSKDTTEKAPIKKKVKKTAKKSEDKEE